MIAILGDAPRKKILKSFLQMAEGKYEINELNTKKKKFQHNSGWGAVYSEKNKRASSI